MISNLIRDVAIVLPSFNEGMQVANTVTELEDFFETIIVVDDGSTDHTSDVLADRKIHYLKHPINLGQGASLQTGITYALKLDQIKYILTFDADGQHSVHSALEMIKKIKESKFDIILGSRFIGKSNSVPKNKKLILRLAILFTRLTTGLKITDTHNGLRVMSINFADKLNINQPAMAHATEILDQIAKHRVQWAEFPAEIHYTDYSVAKGQSMFNAINILTELLHK